MRIKWIQLLKCLIKRKQNISSRVACEAVLTHGFTVRVDVRVRSCGTTVESEAAVWCLCTTLIKPSDLLGASELVVQLSGCCTCGAGRIEPVQQPVQQPWQRQAGLQSQLQPQVCCCAATPPPPLPPPPHSPPWNESYFLSGDLMHSHGNNSFCYSLGLEIKTYELCSDSEVDLGRDLGPADWCHSRAEFVLACICICTSWYPSHWQTWRTATTHWFWPFLMWLVQFSLLSASPRRHLWLLAGSPSSRSVDSSDWQRCPVPLLLLAGFCTLKRGHFFTRHAVYLWVLQ